jgi:hypothetical protein
MKLDQASDELSEKLTLVTRMIECEERRLVATALQVLNSSTSVLVEAEDAIMALRDTFLYEDDHHGPQKTKYIAELLLESHCVVVITLAMEKWNSSLKFALLASDVLKVVVFYFPCARKELISIGGVRLLMDASKQHSFSHTLAATTLAVLGSIAQVLSFEATFDLCIFDFTMAVTKQFSKNEDIQRFGFYFFVVVKPILWKKGALRLLSQIMDHFYDGGKNCEDEFDLSKLMTSLASVHMTEISQN